MPLTSKNIRQLRSLAHHLKPVIILGKAGLSEGVLSELNAALSYHELIKVRINALDKQNRRMVAEEIVQQTSAELVQMIGNIAVFYRAAEKPIIHFN